MFPDALIVNRQLDTKAIMKNGDIITIIPSAALSEMRMEELVNRKAIINEIHCSNSNQIKGCWVTLIGAPFRGEQEWYIPYISIIE